MDHQESKRLLAAGEAVLGIELGSTRIKSVLISPAHEVLAAGSYSWENRLEKGLWTYRLEDAVAGLRESYRSLAEEVARSYDIELTRVAAIGISGMMHGYLALDREGRQLAPFLTWRNTNTAQAAAELTELFQFNIPLRWSIAQLYQAILNGEGHVASVDYFTTLAGYIHLLLSGERVLGVGEASGMFPIDSDRMDYDAAMLEKFAGLPAVRNCPWDIRGLLPKVLRAGESGGALTEAGAKLLDPTGRLRPGIPMAPPEGDAGTGMAATNAVGACTGNVSAGTSIFSMVVLERQLSRLYKDIDMVTTPSGRPVAMVHCNNGSSELDAWVQLLKRFLKRAGLSVSDGELYRVLFEESLEGDPDCGGVLLYNYQSGEPVTNLTEGRPLVVRRAESPFTLANFMRSQIYSIIASLAIGMKILADEKVRIKRLTGHGGLFKTPGVAQRYLSAAMGVPITVMETAGEGGPYGMALLAAFCIRREEGETLEDYLQNRVFANVSGTELMAAPEEVEGYAAYLRLYERALPVEARAVELI